MQGKRTSGILPKTPLPLPKGPLPRIPLPFPNPLPIVEIVIEGIRYLWNEFKNKKEKTSDKIANQKAMDEQNASVDEVVVINQAFNELIQSLKGDIEKIEGQAIEELAYFFEEFIDYMQEHEEMFMSQGVRVNKIVNKFEKVKRKLKGELSKKIYKEISLDNVACREILALRAGDKKRERMNDFIEKAFEKSLHDLIYDIQDEILDIVEDIEMAVEEGLELTQSNINEKAAICQALEESRVYFNYLIDQLRDSNEKNDMKININKIKRELLKIEKSIKGSFKNHLSKRIFIDDDECLNVLKMEAGPAKESAMKNLGNKVLREAREQLCDSIKESLIDEQEYIEEQIMDKIDEMIVSLKDLSAKVNEFEELKQNDEGKIELEKAKCISKLQIVDAALGILE